MKRPVVNCFALRFLVKTLLVIPRRTTYREELHSNYLDLYQTKALKDLKIYFYFELFKLLGQGRLIKHQTYQVLI